MRPDDRRPADRGPAPAGAGLTVRADAGISSPALPWLAGELLAVGVLLGVAMTFLIVVPVRLASRPER